MESINDKKWMDFKSEVKEGRFPETKYNYALVLFRIKGSIAGKDVTIAISPAENKNYIKPKIANQLVFSKSNIIEKRDCYDNKIYDITNLQLNIRDYTFISRFSVQTLWSDQGDIIFVHPRWEP